MSARRSLWPWLVFGALLIAALGLRTLYALRADPGLPVIGMVPDFALVAQDGKAFSHANVEGRVWIASFIYTTCPGPCPRVVQRASEVKRQLGPEPDLRFVSFSVDPQADAPEVLAAYAHSHAIDTTRWSLVTGPVEAVIGLIRNGFLLSVADAGEIDPDLVQGEGPIIHSTRLVLVDRKRRIRGYYETTDPDAMASLVADAHALLRTPHSG